MSIEAHLPALQVAVPLAFSPLSALMRGHWLPWVSCTLVVLYCFLGAIALSLQVFAGGPIVYEIGGWPPPYGIPLVIDSLAALMLVLITGASLAGLVYGRSTLMAEIDVERQPYIFTAWLLATAGLSGIVATGDAFNIFVFLEISSLASYILISAGPDRRALTASFKYLIMGTIGGTFYLIGVGLIYMMTGTLNIADMADRILEVELTRPIYMAAGFITIGLALKAAIFPMHSWMPNAYASAPVAVAVFLSACSTKVALYVLFRIDYTLLQGALPEHSKDITYLLLPLAILGFNLGSVAAIFQKDVKRILGYSSVAQLGYIVAGAALISAAGVKAGLVHMFNHALIKATLFMAIGAVVLQAGKSRLMLADLAGAARVMPWTMAAFLVSGLSLIGVPATAGFISKWYLVLAALEKGVWAPILIFLILVSSLLALIYIWRVVEQAYFTQRPANAVLLKEAPLSVLIPLWIAAAANIFFGFAPDVPLAFAERAAALLTEGLQ